MCYYFWYSKYFGIIMPTYLTETMPRLAQSLPVKCGAPKLVEPKYE